MPELTFPPSNPVWPPAGAEFAQIYRVTSAKESLGGIAEKHAMTFEDLIAFNFGLKRSESKYFEKINWFLKHKLKCRNTTPQGNFKFSGGETLYIPKLGQTFPETPITATPVERRLVQFAYTDRNEVAPRDPEAPHPLATWLSDLIKDLLIEKATGRKPPTASNRNITSQVYREVDKRHVLIAMKTERRRVDMKPSTFVANGSHYLHVAHTLTYGKGDPKAKVPVTINTVWEQANGQTTTNTETRYIDQPTDFTKVE